MWSPTKNDFVARVRVRPGGGRIAWLSRVGDEGLTWIWTGGEGPTRSHVGFLPLQPRRIGVQRFESERRRSRIAARAASVCSNRAPTSRRISTKRVRLVGGWLECRVRVRAGPRHDPGGHRRRARSEHGAVRVAPTARSRSDLSRRSRRPSVARSHRGGYRRPSTTCSIARGNT
jgi:hypothetical protein